VTPSRGEASGGGDAAADASSAGAAMDERETRPLERQAGSMGAAGAEEFPPCVLWPWRAGLFFGLVSSVTSLLSFGPVGVDVFPVRNRVGTRKRSEGERGFREGTSVSLTESPGFLA